MSTVQLPCDRVVAHDCEGEEIRCTIIGEHHCPSVDLVPHPTVDILELDNLVHKLALALTKLENRRLPENLDKFEAVRSLAFILAERVTALEAKPTKAWTLLNNAVGGLEERMAKLEGRPPGDCTKAEHAWKLAELVNASVYTLKGRVVRLECPPMTATEAQERLDALGSDLAPATSALLNPSVKAMQDIMQTDIGKLRTQLQAEEARCRTMSAEKEEWKRRYEDLKGRCDEQALGRRS